MVVSLTSTKLNGVESHALGFGIEKLGLGSYHHDKFEFMFKDTIN